MKTRETLQEEIKREWKNPEIQEEFLNDFECFAHYKEADSNGQISYELTEGYSLEHILKTISKPPYNQTKQVKDFVNKLRNREASSRKKGAEGVFKKLIRSIVENGVTRKKQILNELYSLAKTDNEIICEINKHTQTIHYWENHKEKSVTFARLGNVISDLKNKL